MRIYVIGTRGFPYIQGGVENHCESIYPLLAARGHEVTVFRRSPYINNKNKSKPYKQVEFCDVWTIKSKNFETIIHTLLSSFICVYKRPDIVHLHNIGPSLVLPLLKLSQLATVVTYHSANYKHSKWGKIAKKILMMGETFVNRMADKVIFVSKTQAGLFDREKSYYIPNGVNVSAPSLRYDFVRQIGAVPHEYILAVSRFTPEKGLHDLIRAFKKMDCSHKLVIAGDADIETVYSAELKKMAAGDDRILLTGYIDGEPLKQLFSHAHLFVLPSYHEGLPIALLEAMSYGLSVLVSDIPANKEVDLSQERYFRCGHVEDLQNKIGMLLRKQITPQEQESLRLRIKKNYNWLNIADQTIAVYEKALSKSAIGKE